VEHVTDEVDCRLKLKRPQTIKRYRSLLDECYDEALKEEASGKVKAKL
jgi:long-chain acyl-CoA synthetase